MAATKLKIQYFKNRNGEYQFRAVSRNGNIIFTSGDGYKNDTMQSKHGKV